MLRCTSYYCTVLRNFNDETYAGANATARDRWMVCAHAILSCSLIVSKIRPKWRYSSSALNLDQAAFDPQFRALKLVSVPLGIGLCLRWICTRSYPIVRIVIFFELWASVARLGWLYIESPEQLCSNYLIGEQRLVGTVLLTLALLTGLIGLFIGIFGSYAKLPNKHIAKPIQSK